MGAVRSGGREKVTHPDLPLPEGRNVFPLLIQEWTGVSGPVGQGGILPPLDIRGGRGELQPNKTSMSFLKNDPTLKERRRVLRRNQTDAERLFWLKVRNRHLSGLKFFRQYSFGPYILDFYCPGEKVAIELDGGQHNLPERIVYDTERTAFLETHNIEVIRYRNSDVLLNIEGVLEHLVRRLQAKANPS